MTCGDCDGRGEAYVYVHGSRGGRGFGEWRWMLCFACGGLGTLSEEQEQRRAEGRRLREDRLRRGQTLEQEGRRLGISGAELSRRERGRGRING